jgi:hypothetical protein
MSEYDSAQFSVQEEQISIEEKKLEEDLTIFADNACCGIPPSMKYKALEDVYKRKIIEKGREVLKSVLHECEWQPTMTQFCLNRTLLIIAAEVISYECENTYRYLSYDYKNHILEHEEAVLGFYEQENATERLLWKLMWEKKWERAREAVCILDQERPQRSFRERAELGIWKQRVAYELNDLELFFSGLRDMSGKNNLPLKYDSEEVLLYVFFFIMKQIKVFNVSFNDFGDEEINKLYNSSASIFLAKSDFIEYLTGEVVDHMYNKRSIIDIESFRFFLNDKKCEHILDFLLDYPLVEDIKITFQ